jgi:hypothetical protein
MVPSRSKFGAIKLSKLLFHADFSAFLTHGEPITGQFHNFDRAFRHSPTVLREAVLKEEERLKRARARKRSHKAVSDALK